MKRVTELGSVTLAFAVFGQALVGGCGGDDHAHDQGGGARAGAGGSSQPGTGGTKATGGSNATGGTSNATGGTSNGGGRGGTGQGGSGATGGSSRGGTGASGGTSGSSGAPALMQKTTINLTASGAPIEQIARSVIGPVGNEYEGMGQHSGDSVVLGLKIKLTGITLGQNPPGQPNAATYSLFDWSARPKELAIENGFTGTISDSAELDLPDGDYNVVQVSYLSQYDLKAYAYLDTDKDGEVDTTIYTTATGVKAAASVAAPDDLSDLDYTHYGFTYSFNADSVTDSTTTSFDFTLLPTPARIGTPVAMRSASGDAAFDVLPGAAGAGGANDAGGATAQGGEPGHGGMPSDGGASSDGGAPSYGGAFGEGGATSGPGEPPSHAIAVTLYIDPFRVVKAWDGVPPSGPSDHVDVLFPQGAAESRSNDHGVDLLDLYPLGSPAFGLEYLPTFAFPTERAEAYHTESYLIAPSEPFLVANTQAMSVIFDDAGLPVIGRTGGNVDAASLVLGQAARMFEHIGDDGANAIYRYYVEYGIKDANGVDDGGMYYHNDRSMAGHVVEGFRHLPVGDTAPVVVKDGPRCNAEYNRCLGNRSGVIRRVR